MTVELTPEMESIVSDRLRSGRYTSAQAVLEEAFSALQSQDLRQGWPAAAANRAALPELSQAERDERARRMDELFARIDAEGPLDDFEIERHSSPRDQREPWLS